MEQDCFNINKTQGTLISSELPAMKIIRSKSIARVNYTTPAWAATTGIDGKNESARQNNSGF